MKFVEDRINECQETNSKNLDLSDLEITVLPKSIFLLIQLEILDLSKNKIQTIPNEIAKLTSLKHLFLGYNSIEYVPIEIYQLTQLLTLSLKRNKIAVMPDGISNMSSLTTLNLSNNLLEALPDEIGELESLHSLILYGNRFRPLSPSLAKLNARIDIDDALLLKNAFNEDLGWEKGVWKIPKEFRLPIKQYLLFFTEFYLKTRGIQIQFEIHDHPAGLEIRVKESEVFNRASFAESLIEFVGLVGKEINKDTITFDRNVGNIHQEIVIKDLKNEIRMLEMRLDNKNFNIKLLEKANSDLYNLTTQLAARPNLISINNIQHVNQSNYISQHQELKSNFELLIESLNELKTESRESVLENEVEKLTVLLNEALNSKDKEDLKKKDILSKVDSFLEKLENSSSNIGKTISNVAGIARKIAKMKTILLTIADYLSK